MLLVSEILSVKEIVKRNDLEADARALLSNSSILDYNWQILPLSPGSRLKVSLHDSASSMPEGGYACYGRLFEIDEDKFQISFGGLIFTYFGKPWENITIDMEIYGHFALI